jgi:hypothetical protein
MVNGRRPRVSVVCPAFNRSRLIVDTLSSVRRQVFEDWELLVVSDGSTDDTDDRVRDIAADDCRIRLLRIAHQGHPSPARNLGLSEACGDVVAYLDHDDQWQPNHLQVVVDTVDDGAEIVATGFSRTTSGGDVIAASSPLLMFWHPEIQRMAALFEPSRVAHRAGLAERVGGWRVGTGLEDWDLWSRMADRGLRFTTVFRETAILLDDPGTRIHRTPRRHLQPLATFTDARSARAAQRRLLDARLATAMRQACAEDLQTWYSRLADIGELVAPIGWTGELTEVITNACDAQATAWPDLTVSREGKQFILARRLWCSNAEQAGRVAALSARVHARQLALIREVCSAD